MTMPLLIIIFMQIVWPTHIPPTPFPTLQFENLNPPSPVATFTPIVTSTSTAAPSPTVDVQSQIDEAVTGVEGLPEDLTRDDEGRPLLPDDNNYSVLMSHLKWLLQIDVVGEVLGPFGFMGIFFGVILTFVTVMLIVFVILRIAVLVVRIVRWIYGLLPIVQ